MSRLSTAVIGQGLAWDLKPTNQNTSLGIFKQELTRKSPKQLEGSFELAAIMIPHLWEGRSERSKLAARDKRVGENTNRFGVCLVSAGPAHHVVH